MKYRKTKQRQAILDQLKQNLQNGQLWAAFYDNQFRVAMGLVKLGIIEYEGLSGTFNLPWKFIPEGPDKPWREYYE